MGADLKSIWYKNIIPRMNVENQNFIRGLELAAIDFWDKAYFNTLPVDWEKPGLIEARSLKDIWAHVAAWNTACISAILEIKAGIRPEKELSEEEVDRFNEQVLNVSKTMSAEDVRDWLDSSSSLLFILLRSLNDEDLHEGSRIRSWAYETTIGHYKEHQPAIEKYIALIAK